MLKKSLLLFVLPIVLVPVQLLQFPLSMWVLVAWEEGLKAFASSRERRPTDKFWLVTLFGVWELMVDKPFWGLFLARTMEGWDRVAIGGLILATTVPVLMHAVTAAIYAFTFRGRLWAACIASWAIHTTYNESVDYFGFSVIGVIVETAILGASLFVIIKSQRVGAVNLGRRLISAEPQPHRGELDHGEEVDGDLVVAGADPARVLQLVEEPLDQARSQ